MVTREQIDNIFKADITDGFERIYTTSDDNVFFIYTFAFHYVIKMVAKSPDFDPTITRWYRDINIDKSVVKTVEKENYI